MSKIYETFVKFKETKGWDDAITYLGDLQTNGISLPCNREVNTLIDMYWQSYKILNPDNPEEPDDNPTIFAIRQFVMEKLDELIRDIDKTLESYKDFLQYLYQIGSETTTEEQLIKLYNKTINISFNGHRIKLAFDAVNYNNLVYLVEQAIEEY